VATRKTNKEKLRNPGKVIINICPANLKLNSSGPGVKLLNNAGSPMNNENSGMNTHVRFKKKPKLILEIQARNKDDKYKVKTTGILFSNNAEIIRKAKLTIFILGSRDCKKPSFTEYS
jgi:hypothetical protein